MAACLLCVSFFLQSAEIRLGDDKNSCYMNVHHVTVLNTATKAVGNFLAKQYMYR
jgi:hypothetical protein